MSNAFARMSAERNAEIQRKQNLAALRNAEQKARTSNRRAANEASQIVRKAAVNTVKTRLNTINKIKKLNDSAIRQVFANMSQHVARSNGMTNINYAKHVFRAKHANQGISQAYINRYRRALVGSPSLHSRIGIPFRGGSLQAAKARHALGGAGNKIRSAFGRFGNRMRTSVMKRNALLNTYQNRQRKPTA
jgi:hypothetical protein